MSHENAILWGMCVIDELHYSRKSSIALAWKEMGDLSKINKSKDSFAKVYTKAYQKSEKAEINALFDFCHTMKNGDYVVLRTYSDDMYRIGVVTGEYIFDKKDKVFKHTRSIDWLKHIPARYFSKGEILSEEVIKKFKSKEALFPIDTNVCDFLLYLDKKRDYIRKKYSDWEKERISQLLSYMSDCQQGMRDLNGQILTVLTVVSSLLSLLFGLSIFKFGEEDTIEQLVYFPIDEEFFKGRLFIVLNDLIQRRRLYFWFTSIIFIATVLYIIFLAIESILRYHYSQHLADRLHTLIPGTADDIDRNALLTFEQFSSPIRTLNYNHLSTSHSMFNYFTFYVAGIMAVLFCLGLVTTQYILLPDREWYDHLVLGIVVLILMVAVILLVRFYALADPISERAFEIGNENLEVRKGIADPNKTIYNGAKEYRSFLHYLILPRKDSIFKALLIVYGFAVTSLFCGDFYPTHLIYALLVFEFFLYQGRYQFNDIRGLGEKKTEEGNRKRLVDYIADDKPFRIGMSIIMVVFRFVLAAILILVFGRSIEMELWIALAAFILLLIAYETSRTKKWKEFTILLSGVGFVFRFVVGAMAGSQPMIRRCPDWDKLITMVFFWVWGVMISLMTWMREVDSLIIKGKTETEIMQDKAHYEIIYNMVKKRRGTQDTYISVFAEQGKTIDLLTGCYIILLLLCMGLRWKYLGQNNIFPPIACLVCAALAYINIKMARRIGIIGCIMFALLDIYNAWASNNWFVGACLYYVLIISVITSVCILKREKGKEKEIGLHDVLKDAFIFIFGKEAYEGLELKLKKKQMSD